MIASQVAEQVAMSIAFTYQDVSNVQIEAYIEFLLSSPGVRFTEVMKVALGNAIIEASIQLGTLMFESAEEGSEST